MLASTESFFTCACAGCAPGRARHELVQGSSGKASGLCSGNQNCGYGLEEVEKFAPILLGVLSSCSTAAISTSAGEIAGDCEMASDLLAEEIRQSQAAAYLDNRMPHAKRCARVNSNRHELPLFHQAPACLVRAQCIHVLTVCLCAA